MRLYRSLCFWGVYQHPLPGNPSLWSLLTSTTPILFCRPPLWVSIYLPLSILLQVPGFPFEYFLRDKPSAEYSLHRHWVVLTPTEYLNQIWSPLYHSLLIQICQLLHRHCQEYVYMVHLFHFLLPFLFLSQPVLTNYTLFTLYLSTWMYLQSFVLCVLFLACPCHRVTRRVTFPFYLFLAL